MRCLRAHGTALHTLLRNLLPPTSPSGHGSNLFLLSIPPPCCITDAIAHFRTRRLLLAAMSRLCALMSDKSHVVARIPPPSPRCSAFVYSFGAFNTTFYCQISSVQVNPHLILLLVSALLYWCSEDGTRAVSGRADARYCNWLLITTPHR